MISNNEFDDWGQNQSSDDSAESAPSVDLMQVAMRRKGLIALGVFVGICLGILYYARATPIYESTAMMSISHNTPAGMMNNLDTFVKQTAAEDHAIKISSPFIIGNALKMQTAGGTSLADLPSLADSENPVQDIYDGLTIQPVQEGSEILSIEFRGKNPEECMDILATLISAYTDHLTSNRGKIEKSLKVWISQAKNELEDQLGVLTKELREWEANEGRLIYDGDRTINLPAQTHQRLEEKITLLREKNDGISSQITFLDNLIALSTRDGKTVDYDALLMFLESDLTNIGNDNGALERALIVEKVRGDITDASHSEQRIFPLMLQDKLLSQTYGPEHPKRRALREQINIAMRFRDQNQNAASPEYESKQKSAKQKVDSYHRALHYKLSVGKDLAIKLDSAINRAHTEVKAIAGELAEKRSMEDEIARKNKLYDEVVARLSDAEMLETYSKDNKFEVERLQYASIGEKVAPSLAKSLAAGSMLGFMAGFGLGYLVEMFDKTFRSPQEVSRVLQLPMIGHIPEITCTPMEGSKLSEVLVTAHKPKSPLAENFRAIRTALYFSTGGQQNRVIQSTSPVPGDGKSTLSANLAVTIAQSNKTVLLLDADFRRPTQHKMFGVHNDIGLASVVSGETEPADAIQATEVQNLFIMACGPRPHNPSELLTSPEFADTLATLREQYDFVLIDTPPMLAVTDPGVVAARVDGVIMTLRIRKNGRPSAVRARKILADLDANVLGIVVNGIDHRSGSYGYYSSYRRGYGYGYGSKYGYGQDSTERALGKYYEEPNGETSAPAPAGRG